MASADGALWLSPTVKLTMMAVFLPVTLFVMLEMVGGVLLAMFTEYERDPVQPFASVALTVKLKAPDAVGMPLIVPVLDSDSPAWQGTGRHREGRHADAARLRDRGRRIRFAERSVRKRCRRERDRRQTIVTE
jgi:hypothetical protein